MAVDQDGRQIVTGLLFAIDHRMSGGRDNLYPVHANAGEFSLQPLCGPEHIALVLAISAHIRDAQKIEQFVKESLLIGLDIGLYGFHIDAEIGVAR